MPRLRAREEAAHEEETDVKKTGHLFEQMLETERIS